LPESIDPGTLPPTVSKPAHRTYHALEAAGRVTSELLILAVSAGAGLALLFALMVLGVLPGDLEAAPWSAVLAGPLMLGTAGLAYLGIERLLASGGEAVKPIKNSRERAGVVLGLSIAVGGVLAAIIGSVVFGLIQEKLFSFEVAEQQAIVDLVARGEPWELALLGVAAVVLAPITEELLFRHMFFRRLYQRVGPVSAWILPALAFALAHWNPVGLVIYAWLGTVFAAAYWLSGRLWVAILVHAGHNAFAFAMLLSKDLPELP
jgi:membrane protease YdiL (CAAX protease family)